LQRGKRGKAESGKQKLGGLPAKANARNASILPWKPREEARRLFHRGSGYRTTQQRAALRAVPPLFCVAAQGLMSYA
jgi:hypothetical protein